MCWPPRPPAALAGAAGLHVACDALAPVATVSAATFLGPGKVAELDGVLRRARTGALFANAALTGVQQRNLAAALGMPPDTILDRVAVILRIFARRARSREARLQVTLAQLRHARSRLVSGGVGGAAALAQQRGGIGVMGGAGETKLELDRRGWTQRSGGQRRRWGRWCARGRCTARAARAWGCPPWRWWGTPTWASRRWRRR